MSQNKLNEPTLAKLQTKLLAAQMCHPNAVQALVEEALNALDEFARAALSQPAPAPQPAVPVVSDEQIRKTVESIQDPDTVPAFHNGYYTLTPDELRRAILALRPAVEPMTPFTPSQRMRLWQNTEKGKSATSLGAFDRICQTVEAAHRIGITAKTEGVKP